MTHLDESELIDALERPISARVAHHLDACGTCQTQLDELRRTVARMADDESPLPSAAFWDRFAEGVSRSIAEPSVDRRRFASGRVFWAAAAASVLLAAASGLVLRNAPVPGIESPEPVPYEAELADDEAWIVVRELIAELDFATVREAGVAPAAGAIERAASELSADQRAALARLIEQAMKEEMKRTDS